MTRGRLLDVGWLAWPVLSVWLAFRSGAGLAACCGPFLTEGSEQCRRRRRPWPSDAAVNPSAPGPGRFRRPYDVRSDPDPCTEMRGVSGSNMEPTATRIARSSATPRFVASHPSYARGSRHASPRRWRMTPGACTTNSPSLPSVRNGPQQALRPTPERNAKTVGTPTNAGQPTLAAPERVAHRHSR
jgi:hypothetical protein